MPAQTYESTYAEALQQARLYKQYAPSSDVNPEQFAKAKAEQYLTEQKNQSQIDARAQAEASFERNQGQLQAEIRAENPNYTPSQIQDRMAGYYASRVQGYSELQYDKTSGLSNVPVTAQTQYTMGQEQIGKQLGGSFLILDLPAKATTPTGGDTSSAPMEPPPPVGYNPNAPENVEFARSQAFPDVTYKNGWGELSFNQGEGKFVGTGSSTSGIHTYYFKGDNGKLKSVDIATSEQAAASFNAEQILSVERTKPFILGEYANTKPTPTGAIFNPTTGTSPNVAFIAPVILPTPPKTGVQTSVEGNQLVLPVDRSQYQQSAGTKKAGEFAEAVENNPLFKGIAENAMRVEYLNAKEPAVSGLVGAGAIPAFFTPPMREATREYVVKPLINVAAEASRTPEYAFKTLGVLKGIDVETRDAKAFAAGYQSSKTAVVQAVQTPEFYIGAFIAAKSITSEASMGTAPKSQTFTLIGQDIRSFPKTELNVQGAYNVDGVQSFYGRTTAEIPVRITPNILGKIGEAEVRASLSKVPIVGERLSSGFARIIPQEQKLYVSSGSVEGLAKAKPTISADQYGGSQLMLKSGDVALQASVNEVKNLRISSKPSFVYKMPSDNIVFKNIIPERSTIANPEALRFYGTRGMIGEPLVTAEAPISFRASYPKSFSYTAAEVSPKYFSEAASVGRETIARGIVEGNEVPQSPRVYQTLRGYSETDVVQKQVVKFKMLADTGKEITFKGISTGAREGGIRFRSDSFNIVRQQQGLPDVSRVMLREEVFPKMQVPKYVPEFGAGTAVDVQFKEGYFGGRSKTPFVFKEPPANPAGSPVERISGITKGGAAEVSATKVQRVETPVGALATQEAELVASRTSVIQPFQIEIPTQQLSMIGRVGTMTLAIPKAIQIEKTATLSKQYLEMKQRQVLRYAPLEKTASQQMRYAIIERTLSNQVLKPIQVEREMTIARVMPPQQLEREGTIQRQIQREMQIERPPSPFVPPPQVPPFVPPPEVPPPDIPRLGGLVGGSERYGGGKGAKTGKLKASYSPSFAAVQLNIYGKKESFRGYQSGIGLRPLIGKMKGGKK